MNQFTDLSQTLTTAVVLIDKGLIVRHLNPAAESLFSSSAKRCIDKPVQKLLPRETKWFDLLKQMITDSDSVTERERLLHVGSRKKISVDVTVTSGAFLGYEGLLIELTQIDRHLRISRENTLINQQNATRELIRGMAHEIKNPLGGIRGSAQLLERELPNEDLREYTQIIISEVDRLQSLINRMLGPNQLPQIETINIHEVLMHIFGLVRIEASKNIVIQTDFDPSIPSLQADHHQLVQVFLNLVRNAMQALNGSGNILLRTRVHRHFTIGQTRHRLVLGIEIGDDGPGIPEELQPHLFYPMVSGQKGGSGIGLSIAQHLIHQHKGLIQFVSQPGNTVFTVFLPLEQT